MNATALILRLKCFLWLYGYAKGCVAVTAAHMFTLHVTLYCVLIHLGNVVQRNGSRLIIICFCV